MARKPDTGMNRSEIAEELVALSIRYLNNYEYGDDVSIPIDIMNLVRKLENRERYREPDPFSI